MTPYTATDLLYVMKADLLPPARDYDLTGLEDHPAAAPPERSESAIGGTIALFRRLRRLAL